MSKDVTGTWRLVRTEARAIDDDALLPEPFGGAHAMGRVVLGADGRMAAVLVDTREPLPDGVERAYSSYCGRYTFDGQTLVTRVDAAADPSRLGGDQVRKVWFDGELMVLEPPVSLYHGCQAQRRLWWAKIADV